MLSFGQEDSSFSNFQTANVLLEESEEKKLFLMFFCDVFSSGGIVMASRDGKIVIENTLDARLDVVFRKKLPEVFFQL